MATYTFHCRDTDRCRQEVGSSRLDAQLKLPIGFWHCIFIEDCAGTVQPYDRTIHR